MEGSAAQRIPLRSPWSSAVGRTRGRKVEHRHAVEEDSDQIK